jgi:hypothetical protein
MTATANDDAGCRLRIDAGIRIAASRANFMMVDTNLVNDCLDKLG